MTEETTNRFSHMPGIHELLDIEFVLVTPEKVILRLEVGPKVHQPYGILHGGVSALLAEGAASIGGGVSVSPDLRSMTKGTLTATATPIRKGRTVHVWGIDLTDDQDRLICVARCSLQVLPAPEAPSA